MLLSTNLQGGHAINSRIVRYKNFLGGKKGQHRKGQRNPNRLAIDGGEVLLVHCFMNDILSYTKNITDLLSYICPVAKKRQYIFELKLKQNIKAQAIKSHLWLPLLMHIRPDILKHCCHLHH